MSRGSPTPASASAPANRPSTLPEGEPKFTLGWQAAQWAESILVQPNGPRAGKLLRLTRDQLRFLLWWYAMDPRTGQWLFQHGARRNAKGTGKSPYAAIVALIEFCGPVRLDRRDSRLLGGCSGRTVDMPLVQIAATAESQTQNTMRYVRAFAPKDSAIVDEYGLDPGKTKYYRLPEGTLEVITSSVTASEGGEASLVVADETEHWKPVNAGPELFDTLADNLAKSGCRMLETSNAWVPGAESVAERTWDAWVAQEEGALKDRAGRILYDARIAPPATDLADHDSLRLALEWVYGDCDWKRASNGRLDIKPIIARIWSPMSRPSESRRKYLNQPTVPEESWTTPQAVALLVDETRVVDPAEEIVLFFDGSKSQDSTALVACCMSDGHGFVPRWANDRPTIWEPDQADPESVVPVEEVDLAVAEVFDRYSNIAAFFADVREWESFAKIDWPKRYADRLRLSAQGGKDPQPIAWDMRGHVYEFTRAAELTLAEIADRGFTYDGNPALTRHLHNCRNRPNRHGVSVGKESPASPLKIDAAVCLIGARLVRRLVQALPQPKRRSGVVV